MARVPLVYPKIRGSVEPASRRCIAFEKYNGTNLHWVWEPDLGWYAFGTRRDRFDLDATGIAEFANAYRERLRQAFASDWEKYWE